MNRVCVRRLSTAPTACGQELATAAEVIPGSLLRGIRQRFADELVGIVLFGSTARGDNTEASDIDLLLVLSPGVVLSRELYRRWDAGDPEVRELWLKTRQWSLDELTDVLRMLDIRMDVFFFESDAAAEARTSLRN